MKLCHDCLAQSLMRNTLMKYSHQQILKGLVLHKIKKKNERWVHHLFTLILFLTHKALLHLWNVKKILMKLESFVPSLKVYSHKPPML